MEAISELFEAANDQFSHLEQNFPAEDLELLKSFHRRVKKFNKNCSNLKTKCEILLQKGQNVEQKTSNVLVFQFGDVSD